MFDENKRKDLMEMARVGFVSGLEIYVNTDDAGNIPHFHIRDSVDWEKFHTCVQIEKAEYFIHGNKNDLLNHKQKVALNTFMNQAPSLSKYADRFKNNWELVCFLWDINNSEMIISDDVKQPDYSKLT